MVNAITIQKHLKLLSETFTVIQSSKFKMNKILGLVFVALFGLGLAANAVQSTGNELEELGIDYACICKTVVDFIICVIPKSETDLSQALIGDWVKCFTTALAELLPCFAS